ncbi:MAG: family 20 glycosylhydrolase [Clostridiales bacterium]|nr:family 20 glycosylhydrolase [Clostridiales bacterium]
MNTDIFPKPKKISLSNGFLNLDGLVNSCGCDDDTLAFIESVRSMELRRGNGNIELYKDLSMAPGSYELSADKVVTVKAGDRAGFMYAASALSQLITPNRTIPKVKIEDSPYMSVRGVHMYLPPPDSIDEFCRIIDALVYLRYNTLFLEIGGGMEYERHPEINRAWRRFCREARDYPKGPQGLQASQADWKNSTHIELAGGGVLTKAEVKSIVEYARSRGMQVIPEIQALSHCYYLTLAHREIAERPYEPWPDTYCPLNEDSYRLYFDVADEIYETIQYDKVSIGHDEVRILGYCDRCKGHSGAELLSYEINRLHEHYSAMGVEMWMWGEKLQNFMSFGGVKSGGQALDRHDRFGRRWLLDETHQAIDSVPTDIIMLDWYYAHAPYTEKGFLERGIRQIYGNFRGSTIASWQTRSRRKNVLGAEVSTWCVANEDEIGRNGWFAELTFSSAVLWQDDYDDSKRDEIYRLTARKIGDVRSIVRTGKLPERKVFREYLSLSNPKQTVILDGRSVSWQDSSSRAEIILDRKIDEIVFLHGADFGDKEEPKRVYTWYFLDRTPRIIAHYVFEYEDGIVTAVPIEFGVHTGSLQSDFSWKYPESYEKRFDDETGQEKSSESYFPAPYCVMNDEWLGSAMYFSDAFPITLDGSKGTVYAWSYRNPRPDVKLRSVRLERDNEESVPVRLFGALI